MVVVTGYASNGIEIPMFDGVSFLNANITLGDVSWNILVYNSLSSPC